MRTAFWHVWGQFALLILTLIFKFVFKEGGNQEKTKKMGLNSMK